ncbi:hypothetical protein J437_LFUL019265 [Ladona fulva]|uniref:Uncharacterized protein n=1 Tax=Ladona fulva TaxID=123851 RepID=A0A8K0KQC0_LADFU|nr:hypothetical protein J437_LFUL019265 [Ladona fulva]
MERASAHSLNFSPLPVFSIHYLPDCSKFSQPRKISGSYLKSGTVVNQALQKGTSARRSLQLSVAATPHHPAPAPLKALGGTEKPESGSLPFPRFLRGRHYRAREEGIHKEDTRQRGDYARIRQHRGQPRASMEGAPRRGILHLRRAVTSKGFYPRPRAKRGLLNFGWEALKFLFGTLDDEDLKKLNEHIESMEGREQATIHLLKLQATVINTTYATAQANSKELDKVVKTTKGLVAEVKSLSDELEESHRGAMTRMAAIFSVDSNMRVLEAALAHMRVDLNLFKQAWETTVNGKLSPYFLSPADLHRTLEAYSQFLP